MRKGRGRNPFWPAQKAARSGVEERANEETLRAVAVARTEGDSSAPPDEDDANKEAALPATKDGP